MLNSHPRKNSGFISLLFGSKDQPTQHKQTVHTEMLIRLQELCAKHTFVNVEFVDRKNCSFQSLILKVDSHNQSLLIDELFPLLPDVAVEPGERIEITSCGKGVPVKFSSVIDAIEMVESAIAYRIALPRQIKSNQRREYFRVTVVPEMETHLYVDMGAGGAVPCEIINLSSSGIGFRVDKNISDTIQSNRILKSVRLKYPGGSPIHCELEVKSYEYLKPPHRCTLVGARFKGLSASAQKQLDKLIIQLQRDLNKLRREAG